MNQRHKTLLTLWIILMIGSMAIPTENSFSNIPKKGAYSASSIIVRWIYYTQARGESYMDMEMNIYFEVDSGSIGDHVFAVKIDNFVYDEPRSIKTGESSVDYLYYYTNNNFEIYGSSMNFVTLTSVTSQYSLPLAASTSLTYEVYYADASGGTDYSTYTGSTSNLNQIYEFSPIININSTHYKPEDFRLEVYDKENLEWIPQNINDIQINHPEYKIRLYDKETNNLIYEDSEYVYTTVYRTVDINSTCFINNADEPIIFEAVNNGHYQSTANLSWDLETIGSQPDEFEYSNNSNAHLVNEFENHNKIMTVQNNTYNHAWHEDVHPFDANFGGWYKTVGTGCTVEYLTSKTIDGITVNDIIHFSDTSTSGNINSYFYTKSGGFLASGLFSFSNLADYFEISFYTNIESPTRIGYFRMSSNMIRWLGTSYSDVDSSPEINTWYYFRCQFDIEEQEVYLQLRDLEGNTMGTAIGDFSTTMTSPIIYMRLYTSTTDASNLDNYYSSFYVGNDEEASYSQLKSGNSIKVDYSEEIQNLVDWGSYNNPDYSEITPIYGDEYIVPEVAHRTNPIILNDDGEIQISDIENSDSIECWIWFNDLVFSSGYNFITIEDGGIADSLQVYFADGWMKVKNSSDTLWVLPIDLYTWYHIRIDYDLSTDWHLWVNGDQMDQDGYSFRGNPTDFDNLNFWTYNVDANNIFVVDDIGIVSNGYENYANAGYNYSTENTVDFGEKWDHKLEYGVAKTGVMQWNSSFSEWVNSSGIGTMVSNANWDGHKNIMKIEDQSITTYAGMSYSFSEQISSSIEFYFYSDLEDTDHARIIIGDGTYSDSLYLGFRSTTLLQYYTGSWVDLKTDMTQEQWYHFRIEFDCSSSWSVYINDVLEGSGLPYRGSPTAMDFISITTTTAQDDYSIYFDAIGLSWEGYTEGDNQYLNGWLDQNTLGCNASLGYYDGHTEVIRMIDTSSSGQVYLSYEGLSLTSGFVEFYTQTVSNSDESFVWYLSDGGGVSNSIYFLMMYGYFSVNDGIATNQLMKITEGVWYHIRFEFEDTSSYNIYINGECHGTYNTRGSPTEFDKFEMLTIESESGVIQYMDAIGFSSQNYESWSNLPEEFYSNGTLEFWEYHENTASIIFENKTIELSCSTSNIWNRYTINWNDNYTEIFRNSILVENYSYFPMQCNWFQWISHNGDTLYIDAIDTSINNTNFILGTNANLNWSLDLFNSEGFPYIDDSTVQVNPYQNKILNGTYNWIRISDLYDNLLESQNFTNPPLYIEYTPPNLQECFISISDQQGKYMDWEQFKIKLNGTLIYENRFLRELGVSLNISLYDRFDQLITWTTHTVTRNENYIPVQITLHSLKIFNQQEVFNHVNITENPITSMYWSEWLAPGEITEYRLLSGNYIVNITTNEEGGDVQYAYTLNGDDTLIISSENTITNMITNIANVNTTIGNQITEVNISISNTQSDIENQIISVNIDLSNVNSTLTDQLLSLSTDINNLNANITTLFSFTNNSLINLNSSLSSNFYSVETHLDFIDSNMTQLTILLENDILMLNNSINSSELAILTQILAINNTISQSITDLQQSVYLVNNSIYTAVAELGTTLSLVNNSIQGNLSFLLQINPELTEIYVNTMFSEYLNWSTDVDAVRDQTTTYSFINNYRDISVNLLLRYLNETESILLGAQETLNQAFIDGILEYRVFSVTSGDLLTDWTQLEETTIDIGFYEENIPTIPETILDSVYIDYLIIGLTAAVCIVAIGFLAIRYRSNLNILARQGRRKPVGMPSRGISDDYWGGV